MSRSIPMKKALDDVLVAYGQNGEAIRPEQGYPLRLMVPGFEGNINVKWLRRIKVVDQPYMTKDETSKYTDLMPDGTARQFTFEMDAKSLITFPSGGQKLAGPGFYEITGLAWSAAAASSASRSRPMAAKAWQPAQLDEPRLDGLHELPPALEMGWPGSSLQSRCTDETGYVQPSREALLEARGLNSQYHNNCITIWTIAADGGVHQCIRLAPILPALGLAADSSPKRRNTAWAKRPRRRKSKPGTSRSRRTERACRKAAARRPRAKTSMPASAPSAMAARARAATKALW